ncbi:MAG: hypothetical protein QXY45_02635 [Candidatus Aenigmatarchaeota archaeon]
MKGVVNIFELLITAIILILAFLHFFPQYSIHVNWDSALLDSYVKDTLITIDRLGQTYTFAADDSEFENFMSRLFDPSKTGQALIWWKEVRSYPLGISSSTRKPYFSSSAKESLVDVVYVGDTFYVYSFTLGIGYPY